MTLRKMFIDEEVEKCEGKRIEEFWQVDKCVGESAYCGQTDEKHMNIGNWST